MGMAMVSHERKQEVATSGYMGSKKLTNETIRDFGVYHYFWEEPKMLMTLGLVLFSHMHVT